MKKNVKVVVVVNYGKGHYRVKELKSLEDYGKLRLNKLGLSGNHVVLREGVC